MKLVSPLLIAAALLCGHAIAADAPAKKPNIIVLFTDDQGYADLSIHGNKDYQTPHLDSLARNGVQIFPGGVPIYRGATLVGAIGVSGDGVDQDDMIAFLGVHDAGRAVL